MIEALIKAERECTSAVDVLPEKVLRPIGTIFREWLEDIRSNDLPHWISWRVKGYGETYRGRRGDTILYERHEELESFEPYIKIGSLCL